MAEGILHAGIGERFVERQCYNILSFPNMREKFFSGSKRMYYNRQANFTKYYLKINHCVANHGRTMTELGIYHKWEKIGVYMNIYQVVSLTEYLYCLDWSIIYMQN